MPAAEKGAAHAGSANDVGWDNAETASEKRPHSEAGPAHRPGEPANPQASFAGMRQLLTSRARTVSSRAGTAHVLEVPCLQSAIITPPLHSSLHWDA